MQEKMIQETTTITFKRKTYEINIKKTEELIKILENKEDFKFKNKKHIIQKLKEHKLLDELFLKNANKL